MLFRVEVEPVVGVTVGRRRSGEKGRRGVGGGPDGFRPKGRSGAPVEKWSSFGFRINDVLLGDLHDPRSKGSVVLNGDKSRRPQTTWCSFFSSLNVT